MLFQDRSFTDLLTLLIPLILSLSVHECAHAWAAWKLGDDTAAMMGRLTLNPLAHIDPVGTLLLPLLGVPFGWAKPVPVNPLRFTRRFSMRTGMMLTAAAGPLSNLLITLSCTVLLAMVIRFEPFSMQMEQAVQRLLFTFIYLNIILAVFNMLPIPPLDGSRVVDWAMPRALRPGWENFCRLGPLALAAVIVLPALTGHSLFAEPVRWIMGWLTQLVWWLS